MTIQRMLDKLKYNNGPFFPQLPSAWEQTIGMAVYVRINDLTGAVGELISFRLYAKGLNFKTTSSII